MVTCRDRGRGARREHEPEAPRPLPPLPRGQGRVQSSGDRALLAGAAARPMKQLFQLQP